MRAFHKLILVGLLVLAGVAVAALIWTRAPGSSGSLSLAGRQNPLVDQRPLETASALAALAQTPDEQRLAQDAVRVADQEVDLAFDTALRNADEQPHRPNQDALAAAQRIQQIQAQIARDQAKVKNLTAQSAHAKARDEENLQEQIAITQAELSFDQDELADAQQDLIRAGGDARSKVQQLWEEHEAAEHTHGSVRVNTAAPLANGSVSLIAKGRGWSALRARRQQILEARRQALDTAARLGASHQALEKQTQDEQARNAAPAGPSPATAAAATAANSSDAASALKSLHHLSADEKDLADLDKRIQDLQQLGTIYDQWSALVGLSERAALHSMIRSVLWIILAILVAFVVNRLADHFFQRFTLERNRQLTLRAIVRFSVEALAVLVILLVIFGSPSQLSTILGLAGAGLTVALKDFIVSFLGWFVLMGRNGIRVGDWVEINGVRGEVIEIGLLRTVLLETGNWTEPGHPTGRQVAFLNTYAVEGYYFNFSTSGQWLWDELQVLIPARENPYPIIEKIRAIVAQETQSKAEAAEKAWQQVTRRYGVKSFSATPAVTVRPTDLGVQVVVRYITRANERSDVRARLYHAAVKLLHREEENGAEPALAPASAGVVKESEKGQGE